MDKSKIETNNMEWKVFALSAGSLFVFVIASLMNHQGVGKFVSAAHHFITAYLGGLLQGIFFLIFVACLVIAFSKFGKVRVGGQNAVPEISTFRWFAIILTTLLAGGGVFFSAAEPMWHFLSTPPAYSTIESASGAAVAPALAVSYLHWGFLAWAVQAIGVSILVYACEVKGMPLKTRSLIYPVFGEKGVMGPAGTIMDACSLVAVSAGTIGPIGFLALQLSYSLNALLGVPNTFATQALVLIVITAIFTIGASTGIYKGIDFLSRWTIYLAIAMIGAVLVLGPGRFILDSFLAGMGLYLTDFPRLSLFRGDPTWSGWWTAFYWAWFLSYAPMMSIMLVRISKGRTLKEILLVVSLFGPIMTNFWFSILGGTGIFMELQNPGAISGPLNSSGMPAALLTIMQNMPLSIVLVPLSLLLVILFLVTTGAGITYSMSIAVTGMEEPYRWVRVVWGVLMGAAALMLVRIGESSISALQNFIVIAAIPLFLFYVPQVLTAIKCAIEVYKHQYNSEEAGESVADTVREKS